MSNLTPVQQLILARFKPDKDIKLTPGPYEGEFTVHVVGKFTVAEDTEVQESVDWKKIALHILETMTTREAIKVAKEAMDSEVDENLEEKVKTKLAPILGKVPRKGAVRGTTFAKLFGPEKDT